MRDIKRLTRLLTDKIETIEPGFGIEIIILAATLAEPLADKQAISSLIDETAPDVSDLIDTLANRIGERRLYRMARVASDVPERSVARISPTAPEKGEAWPESRPLPSRLLTPPEPVDTVALLPDHPPVASRKQVNRALKSFSEAGWVTNTYRSVTITDAAALRRFAEGDGSD